MSLVVVATTHCRIDPAGAGVLHRLKYALEPLHAREEFWRDAHFVFEAPFELARAQTKPISELANSNQSVCAFELIHSHRYQTILFTLSHLSEYDSLESSQLFTQRGHIS